MNIINEKYIEFIKPYVADKLRIGEDKIFIDFRTIYVGDLSSVGVLGTENGQIIVTEDTYNCIAIGNINGSYTFNPNNGDYYYFLGYIGNDIDLEIDDTYKMSLSNKCDNTGFFFEKLTVKSDSLPQKIYTLRFRRLA